MKEVFKYTFTTVAEWKKFFIVVLIISIFTLLEPYPFIGYTVLILEKLLYLSIGAFLIYIVKHSKDEKEYFENLKKNDVSTMLFHFFPTAAGIMLGSILISAFWFIFFFLILQFTNSLYILANPHSFFVAVSSSPVITQILLGFYSIYLLFFSYVFLGKLGEALGKNSFKGAFVSIILSLIDFQYWIKTFNLKYFIIYLVWSIVILFIYSAMSFTYIFVIFPNIVLNPNLSLLIIPILVAATTIITYFTFFSAYFANKTTGRN